MTEANRLAKIDLQKAYRETGKSISKVKASIWTQAAKNAVETNFDYYKEKAEASLSRAAPATIKGMDLLGMIQEDPELARKAEKKKADSKKATAAKAAGKTSAKPPAKAKKNPSHGVNA
jgi:hypothetical protein